MELFWLVWLAGGALAGATIILLFVGGFMEEKDKETHDLRQRLQAAEQEKYEALRRIEEAKKALE